MNEIQFEPTRFVWMAPDGEMVIVRLEHRGVKNWWMSIRGPYAFNKLGYGEIPPLPSNRDENFRKQFYFEFEEAMEVGRKLAIAYLKRLSEKKL